MILYETGKAYWEVAKRFHAHRNTSPMIKPTAVRDMQRLQATVRSQAVLRRINSFIMANQQKPPGKNPDGDGPRYA